MPEAAQAFAPDAGGPSPPTGAWAIRRSPPDPRGLAARVVLSPPTRRGVDEICRRSSCRVN